MKLKMSDIKVRARFRQDLGSVESLAVDIQKHGLYHPIIVGRCEDEKYKYELVAGERRYRAHEMLGWEEIEVRPREDLDELGKREIEIEENLQRKDFTWQEEIRAKAEIDQIKRKMYGHAIKGHGGGWSLRDTARSIGESLGTVSQDIKLARALEDFPELASEKNKASAFKKYQRMRERALSSALAEKVDVKASVDSLIHGDAEKVMKKMVTESVDLVLTDPPFGIDLDKSMKSKGSWGGSEGVYEDKKYDVLDVVDKVMRECYRVLKNDRHMYVFFAVQHMIEVKDMLHHIGFNVCQLPNIWAKTGGGGQGGGEYAFASNYEAFFLCMKGRRPLNKLGVSNVFTDSRVPPQRKTHPAEKPTSLLRKLIEQSTVPGEMVIDPFSGSGSTLIAAFESGRRGWGCEKKKEFYDKTALRLKKIAEA